MAKATTAIKTVKQTATITTRLPGRVARQPHRAGLMGPVLPGGISLTEPEATSIGNRAGRCALQPDRSDDKQLRHPIVGNRYVNHGPAPVVRTAGSPTRLAAEIADRQPARLALQAIRIQGNQVGPNRIIVHVASPGRIRAGGGRGAGVVPKRVGGGATSGKAGRGRAAAGRAGGQARILAPLVAMR